MEGWASPCSIEWRNKYVLCSRVPNTNSYKILVFYPFSQALNLEVKLIFPFSLHHNILEFLWFQAKFFLDAFHFCFWKVDTFLELSKFRQYHSYFTGVSNYELKDNGNELFPFPSFFNLIPFLSTDALYLTSLHLTRWKSLAVHHHQSRQTH
jgi:hypothetical protein